MSAVTTLAAVEAELAAFPDPETGRGLLKNGQAANVRLEPPRLSLTLALTTHSSPLWSETKAALEERLRDRFADLREVNVTLAVHHRPPTKLGQIGLTAKSVIAVGSGKGGVGKSTIAASLALGLKRAGCVVGLLDADVYGPSIPHLLGAHGQVVRAEQENKVLPVMADGLPVMSVGFMAPPGQAVIWRGPMLHGWVTQSLRDILWGDLDYLIIDMPPGTGDVALSLSQALPLTGAVVVCTPQEVALIDAVRAIAMFRTVKIPVLGMVENMSGFLCPDNGKTYDIFGRGGARQKAEELNVPFLGEVPITIPIRTNGDAGRTIDNFVDPQTAAPLERVCYQLVKNLSRQNAAKPSMPSLPVLG